ncbi:MAG: heme o synthase [Nitrososphaerota archaeon]
MRKQSSMLARATRAAEVYFRVTKPRVWWLLVFTGVGGLFLGTRGIPTIENFIYVLIVLISGSAGAETIANYLEIDIDRLMRRTMNRPLPLGLIDPPEKALAFGIVLISISILLAFSLNIYVVIFLIFGIIDYVIIYVMLAKRRTPLNILFGSFAGGAPAIIGYVAATNQIAVEGFIIAALVVLWIPSHVWSLALRYKDDYARANIPMMPIRLSERKAVRCIASTAFLMFIFSVMLYLIDPQIFGLIYLGITLSSGVILLYLSLRLFLSPTQTNMWRLFKFSSPHLALIFLAIIIDSLL